MTSIAKDGRIEFWFFRRDVNDVRIVGDFDGTADGEPCGGVVAMSGGSDGWWRATLALAAGEYRFRYVADGVWYADYASNGIETSKLGLNSILVVPDWAGHPSATTEGVRRMVA